MRQSILEAQQKAEEQYNKLYSDIQLAQAKAEIEANLYATKKAIDNRYSGSSYSSGNRGTLGSSSTISSSSGNSSGSIGTYGAEVYSNGMSYTQRKDKFQAKYDNGEFASDMEAIAEVYANFDETERASVLKSVMGGMTEKQAEKIYKDGYANIVLQALADEYGELTDSNRINYESEIVGLADAGYISEEIVELLDKEMEQITMYNKTVKLYMEQEDKVLKFVSEFENNSALKKAMKKTTLSSQLEIAENNAESLISELGQERYNKLIEMLREREDEIREILSNKGIDW